VAENDWSLLPFMALSDGAHAYDTPLCSCIEISSFTTFPSNSSYGKCLAPSVLTLR
jgi:Transport protein Avl9